MSAKMVVLYDTKGTEESSDGEEDTEENDRRTERGRKEQVDC